MRRPRSRRLGDGGKKFGPLTRCFAGSIRVGQHSSAMADLAAVQIEAKPGKRVIHHRCLDRHQIAPRHVAPAGLPRCLHLRQLVADAARKADLE